MRRTAALLAAATALVLSACSGSDGGGGGDVLTVYAASSLTAPFTELGRQFEAEHPGVTVEFSFAGSSDLVAQIQEGVRVPAAAHGLLHHPGERGAGGAHVADGRVPLGQAGSGLGRQLQRRHHGQ